jgi:PAS domain-containing protein
MDFELFESFFEGVLVIDQNLRVVYANPSAKKILGDKLKIGEGAGGSSLSAKAVLQSL